MLGMIGAHERGMFSATVVDVSALDPGEATVSISVTNSGSKPQIPFCAISLSSPGGAYTGFDQLSTTDAIDSGQSVTMTGTITITNNGATYVTAGDSTVSCS